MKNFTLKCTLSTLVIFLMFSVFSFPLYAGINEQIQTEKITLDVKYLKISDALDAISRESKVRIFYKSDLADLQKKVNLDFKDEVLFFAIKKVLSGTNLDFETSEKGVVIIPRATVAKTTIAQQPKKIAIKGKVIGEDKKPIPGATIVVVGTSNGAITDDKGQFNFSVSEGDNLEITFVGMITTNHKVVSSDDSKELVIVLKFSAIVVEDVVVTGIFKRTKELATGSSITVTGAELKNIGNQNILQSLRTLDPSFKIVENNMSGSDPNSMPEIELRGANGIPDLDATYKGNPNQPLFILDGFEASLQKIVDLDPNRVESISILKDASAAALYGSRSANGVIVIETKAPELGRLRLSYTGDFAIVMPDLTDYDLLNAAEKLELQLDAGHFNGSNFNNDVQFKEFYNRTLRNVKEGVDTYWMSKPLRTVFENRHNFNLTGGDDVLRYGLNFSARMTPGVMKGSNRDNFQGGVFLQYRKGGFIFKNDLQVTYNMANDSPYGSFSQYVKMNPYVRPYDENGKPKKLFDEDYPDFLGGATLNRNPLYDALLNIIDNDNYTNITENISVEWNIMESLTLMGRFSLSKQMDRQNTFYPANHTKFESLGDPLSSPDEYMRRGEASFGTGDSFNLSGDINLRYGKAIGSHNLFVVLGANMLQNTNTSKMVKVEGFANENMSDIGFAKQYYKDSRPESAYGIMRLAGLLATVNYSYDRRYLFDFSIKVDGSSNFGANNRYAPVWSLGLGWNLHKEKWLMDSKVISMMKIRGSYGVTASQNFSPFQAESMYSYDISRHYAGIITPSLKGLGNSNLKWQTTKIINIGYELGLVNDRFILNLDVYKRLTDNLLADVTLAPSSGFSSFKENIGQTENKGIDFTARAMIIRNPGQKIFWSVNLSLANNENKITKISNSMKKRNEDTIENARKNNTTTPIILYQEGQSLSNIYAVPSFGIDPATGKEMFLTSKGLRSYVWDAADQIALGNTKPKIEGVVGTSLTYKDLSFSINFRYKYGGQIYNNTLVQRVENADLYGNVDRRIYDSRWRKPGDNVIYKDIADRSVTRPTSRFVQDENIISCESVSLGYDIKSKSFLKALCLERLRVNAYMNDIFRISTVKQERGIDYPFANRFAFSINATF